MTIKIGLKYYEFDELLVSNSNNFQELEWVNSIMNEYPKMWYYIGGWSIDLFLGKKTRNHSDIEFSIHSADQEYLYTIFKDYDIQYILPKGNDTSKYKIIDWKGEKLELPIHQLRVKIDDRELDIMLSLFEDNNWQFRRDPTIFRELSKAILTRNINGVTYNFLAPEITLLFKSKYKRDKDEDDFSKIANKFNNEQIVWLKKNLVIHYGPDDSWSLKLQDNK